MNTISTDIHEAVLKELAAANEIHPLFASLHEGFAVSFEESCECMDEMKCIDAYMGDMWIAIRQNKEKRALECAEIIMKHAELLAAEACQLAAMMKKIEYSEEARK